jgi:GNAT superfamily N-acetyltransferase
MNGRRPASPPEPAPALTAARAFSVGPLGPAGLEAARALHRRCSARTLAARYPGPPAEADGFLPHLLAPRHGHTLAARARDGALVGLGHLLWDGEEEAEVALLVPDAWQRCGVGSALLRRLAALATASGHVRLYAVAPPDAAGAATAVLRTLGVPVSVRREADAVVLSARPAPDPCRLSPARALGVG